MLLPVVIFYFGWCYANVYVADVMSTYCNTRRYCMAYVIANMSVVDVITTGADAIALFKCVADGIATLV